VKIPDELKDHKVAAALGGGLLLLMFVTPIQTAATALIGAAVGKKLGKAKP
jgi:hypothetical protein